MRNRYYIFIILAAFVSCTPYPSESKRMTKAFEQARIVYGEGENDTLLFIPELDKASNYYANKKDYEKAALSALYYGYSEKDYNRQEAMKAFEEAEQYGKQVHDSLTIARAAYQMGKMLYYDGLSNEALPLLFYAENHFGNHYTEKAQALNTAACCHILLQEYDCADSCLSKGLILAVMDHSNEAKTKILNNRAKLFQIQGAYDKAIQTLRMVEPATKKQVLLNNLNIGDFYFTIGEIDSAVYYYRLVEENLSDTEVIDETKAAVYGAFAKLAEYQGNLSEALEYQKKDMEYIVRVKNRIERDGVYRVQQQFNYERIRNEMSKRIIDRQRIILVMSFVVVFFFVVLVALRKRLSKTQKQEKEAQELAMFYILRYSNLLTQQGKTIQKMAVFMENKNDKALLDNLRATVFDNKTPWEALLEVFDTLHPHERERIEHQYPELTELEIKDIILSYFKVSRQDEAILLKMGIHSVDKLRNSVRKKTQG